MACSAADQDELDQLNEDLVAVRKAIDAILSGGQSYTLNTSQTQQSVTRANLRQLQDYRSQLRSEIRALEVRCGLSSTTRVIPGF